MDFTYAISDMDLHSLTRDIMNFAFELAQAGAQAESFYDYEQASSKYSSALFVLGEIERECYHTLRFSNEDTNSSHEDDEKKANEDP